MIYYWYIIVNNNNKLLLLYSEFWSISSLLRNFQSLRNKKKYMSDHLGWFQFRDIINKAKIIFLMWLIARIIVDRSNDRNMLTFINNSGILTGLIYFYTLINNVWEFWLLHIHASCGVLSLYYLLESADCSVLSGSLWPYGM